MNEIQIIQNQLATERAHFGEIAALCAAGTSPTSVGACADYFSFAVTRFEPAEAERLASQLAKGLDAAFLRAFDDACRAHFEKVDSLLGRSLPVTEWRAVSRIDADSIFAERARYTRVKTALST